MKWRAGLICSGCGERFRSQRPFDRHRMRRPQWRCMTRQELLDRGWTYKRSRGGWTDQPRQRRFNFAAAARAVDVFTVAGCVLGGSLTLVAMHFVEVWQS